VHKEQKLPFSKPTSSKIKEVLAGITQVAGRHVRQMGEAAAGSLRV
jgi:hypothetical protein